MFVSRRFVSSVFAAACMAAALPALAQVAKRLAPEVLSKQWILLNQDSIQVDVPNSGVNLNKPACVAITYTINTDGSTTDLKVAKSVPATDLTRAALSAVSHFRYGPSLTNKGENPVATYYIVPFNGPDDKTQQAALMAPCKLPGYPTD